MWPDKTRLKCPAWLNIQVAISPDGRYAYYSNVAGTAYDGKRPADIDPRWPQGRIYRQDLAAKESTPERSSTWNCPISTRTPTGCPAPGTKRRPPRASTWTPRQRAGGRSGQPGSGRDQPGRQEAQRHESAMARQGAREPQDGTLFVMSRAVSRARCRRANCSRSPAAAATPRSWPDCHWRAVSADRGLLDRERPDARPLACRRRHAGPCRRPRRRVGRYRSDSPQPRPQRDRLRRLHGCRSGS